MNCGDCNKKILRACSCSLDVEDINPKVLQTLGSEKMKVSSKQTEDGAT